MTVRVVSYNLLVPLYGDRPDYYVKCRPEFLKTNYRWSLIEPELEKEIHQHANTIICLQEIDISTLPKLELFFRRLNYSFFSNLYGAARSGYMGVGIAIPTSMQLKDVSYVKICDFIRSKCKRRENTPSLWTWATNLYQSALSRFIQIPADPWQTAMTRNNTLIFIEVMIDGKSLCVGTYHMPCLYKEPAVMSIHASVLKDLMFQLADENNFILAGDFNIKPKDPAYQALTEKGYRDNHYPKSDTYDVFYHPNTEQVLKSAYREKTGSEPIYTNFSYTDHSSVFCETLDYIFFTGQLNVEQVLELPDQPIGESYPDETHPSDHLMIAATFRIS